MRTRVLLVVAMAAILAALAAGCGGGGSGSDESAPPAETASGETAAGEEVDDTPTEEPAETRANLDKPPLRWTSAVAAFKEANIDEAALLAKLKRDHWRSVTAQDFEILTAWYKELERGEESA